MLGCAHLCLSQMMRSVKLSTAAQHTAEIHSDATACHLYLLFLYHFSASLCNFIHLKRD